MGSIQTSKIIQLKGLYPEVYEHDLDKKALNSLEGTPGLEFLVKKLNQLQLDNSLRIQFTGSGLRITENNMPDLYQIFFDACETIFLPEKPEFYLMYSEQLNAFTSGVEKPIVVLSSECIDCLNEDELRFIIGHELGHIKSNHVLYYQMASYLPKIASAIEVATLGVGGLFTGALQGALQHWRRMSEFTADRAGLLACQNIKAVSSTFLKLSGLPKKYFNTFPLESFIEQYREFKSYNSNTLDSSGLNISDKVAKTLGSLSSSHPWTVLRNFEVSKWYFSEEYQQILKNPASFMLQGHHANHLPSAQISCPSCGHIVISEHHFCGKCGTPLK